MSYAIRAITTDMSGTGIAFSSDFQTFFSQRKLVGTFFTSFTKENFKNFTSFTSFFFKEDYS